MTTDEATTPPKRNKQRSPSYPGIGLESALERARTLREAEGRHVAPNEAILQHWGYSQKSSAGLVTLAALKRFGLLTTEGPGRARLSDLALGIILDDRELSPERDELIKQAALMPNIHAEIWNQYGGALPSDPTLRHFLRLEKGFTDGAANELVLQFRDTISFANLPPCDGVSTENGDEEGVAIMTEATLLPVTTSGRGGVTSEAPGADQHVPVPIPLSATEWVALQGNFPLSEENWLQLMRVLEVMKPGLVAPPSAEDTDETD